MKYRKLRITWSLFCGLTGVLFCGLWVQTVHKQDKAAAWISASYYCYGDAFHNWMEVSIAKPKPQPEPLFRMNYPRYYHSNFVANPTPLTSPVHNWHVGASNPPFTPGITLRTPIWAGVLLSAMIGTLPWGSQLSGIKRFSVRTLLIATTLVAVVLGLAVYAARGSGSV